MKPRVYLSSPHMSGHELKYVHEAFDQNWIAPLGPNVDRFEETLGSYCGVKHAAALSSGTAALHLALVMLGVKTGDEVLVSSFTFSASVNPIVYQGATPVFIDSELDTWNMDPDLLEAAILDRRAKGGTNKIKAIVVVHLYGMPAKMDKIMEVANRYDIPVIEDAAEALGSKYNGKALGSFGKMAILSFNGNKIITTSGGGALISDDESLIKKARFLATQARDQAPHYQHSEIGYNYRMSNVLAGIGRGQMEVIDDRISKRREIYSYYKKNLDKFEGIKFLSEPGIGYFSNFWLTTVLIDESKLGVSKEKIAEELAKHNIETRPVWKPMHLQPVFKNFASYLNNNSEYLFKNGLCLPSGSNMSETTLKQIVDIICQTISKKS
ncbi:aminotransferase class I/II-fold pyridoxal phosphate-dependent enzyme [Labilibacter sediminis]|nr:aminotransferase class I/II-fold pyridoxal phosphate-dependent enzyme [Labilibacter sediminis]